MRHRITTPGSGSTFVAQRAASIGSSRRARRSASRACSRSGTRSIRTIRRRRKREFGIDVGEHGKAFIRQLWQQIVEPGVRGVASRRDVRGDRAEPDQHRLRSNASVRRRTRPATRSSTPRTAPISSTRSACARRSSRRRGFNADGFFQLGDSLYSTYASPNASAVLHDASARRSTTASRRSTRRAKCRFARASIRAARSSSARPARSRRPSRSTGRTTARSRPACTIRKAAAVSPTGPSRNDRYVTLLSADIYKSNLTELRRLRHQRRAAARALSLEHAHRVGGERRLQDHRRCFLRAAHDDLGHARRSAHRRPLRYRQRSALERRRADRAAPTRPGFAVEAGYRLGSTLRLAGGYNFSGFADPDTAINPTHRGIYVTLSTYIDRIFGWGKDDR